MIARAVESGIDWSLEHLKPLRNNLSHKTNISGESIHPETPPPCHWVWSFSKGHTWLFIRGMCLQLSPSTWDVKPCGMLFAWLRLVRGLIFPISRSAPLSLELIASCALVYKLSKSLLVYEIVAGVCRSLWGNQTWKKSNAVGEVAAISHCSQRELSVLAPDRDRALCKGCVNDTWSYFSSKPS